MCEFVLGGTYLTDKTVLVTGGGSGIGKEIARVAARNGAKVIICSRNLEKLLKVKKEIEEEINAKNTIFCIKFDMMDTGYTWDIFEKIVNELNLSKIDILVNNAGICKGNPIGSTSVEEWNEVMDTNLRGTYFLSQEFSNYLLHNKIKGNILNISSVSASRPAFTPYMISKWGISGLTKGLAKKLIKFGIVVNGIAPGPTATEMLNLESIEDLTYDKSPSGRYVLPIEVANLAIFLISPMGRMIVGETVNISGGCGTLTLDDLDY